VSNLCRLVREARHDLLVITDSDVRVEPGYLRSVAAMFRDPKVGGVTALYRGIEQPAIVAAMDCVGSSVAFCGAALVARELEGVKFMMGSTMATTKRHLAEMAASSRWSTCIRTIRLGAESPEPATASNCSQRSDGNFPHKR